MRKSEAADPYDPLIVAQQDMAMRHFMADASRRPTDQGDAFVLEEQLWRVGAYLQRAIEGFARSHPDYTEFSATADSTQCGMFHEGVAAYEAWMTSRTLPDKDSYTLTFSPPQETRISTVVSINQYHPGDIEFDQGLSGTPHGLLGYVTLRNTMGLQPSPENDFIVCNAATHGSLGHPEEKYVQDYAALEDNPRYDEAAMQIAEYMGSPAREVLQQYGRVGLYRFALWQHMRIIAASV